MSKKHRASQARTRRPHGTQVIIVEPADLSFVGLTFDVLGTTDAPANTTITVELWNANGSAILQSKTDQVDAEGTWGVPFTVAAGDYQVKAYFTGLASPPIANVTAQDFAILNPEPNGDLGTETSVIGCCSELLNDPTLTIRVTYSDGTTTVEQDAVTNPSAGTWEAFFSELPVGSGTLTAECSDGHTATASGLTVTETGTLEAPVDGEVITNPHFTRGRVATTAKEFKGRVNSATNEVYVSATKHGKHKEPPIKLPVKPNGKWSVEYTRLFRQNLPTGRFHFHVLVREPGSGKRFYVCPGRFRLK